MEERSRNLLDQVRNAILNITPGAPKTSYVYWIKRFIPFHNQCHAREMGSPGLEALLTLSSRWTTVHRLRRGLSSASSLRESGLILMSMSVCCLRRKVESAPSRPRRSVTRCQKGTELRVGVE